MYGKKLHFVVFQGVQWKHEEKLYFFAEFTKHLEHFVKHKLSTDPKWKKLTIIFSGPNVPGEGEHKIMQFLREQRETPDYDPNLRHCIMGQDGDLMMLGLLTHEPNMVLLREKVVFNMSSARLEKAHAAEAARKDEEARAHRRHVRRDAPGAVVERGGRQAADRAGRAGAARGGIRIGRFSYVKTPRTHMIYRSSKWNVKRPTTHRTSAPTNCTAHGRSDGTCCAQGL